MTLDIESIMSLYSLEKKEVAKALFPLRKYPALAMKRVLNKEMALRETQVHALAKLCNTSVEELYSDSPWKTTSNKGVISFTNGEFKAELNTTESPWVTRVYKKSELVHEYIMHEKSITLSEFLSKINSIIK